MFLYFVLANHSASWKVPLITWLPCTQNSWMWVGCTLIQRTSWTFQSRRPTSVHRGAARNHGVARNLLHRTCLLQQRSRYCTIEARLFFFCGIFITVLFSAPFSQSENFVNELKYWGTPTNLKKTFSKVNTSVINHSCYITEYWN